MKINTIILLLLFASCNNNNKVNSGDINSKILDSVIVYYKNKEYEKCIQESRGGIMIYPNDDELWQFLGASYIELKKDSLAKNALYKSLTINPKNERAMINLGRAFDTEDSFEKAKTYYEDAIKINPGMYQIYSNFATNRLLSGDYKSAIEYGQKAYKLGFMTSDEAMLCLAYYKYGMYKESDSLYDDLKSLNYKNINDLKECLHKK